MMFDLDGRPVERIEGRPQVILHQPRWLTFALHMMEPAFLESLKQVPEEYIEEDVEDETWLAKVRCPCGEEHLLELGASRTSDCNRAFFYFGVPGVRGRRGVFAARLTEDSALES